MCRETIRRAVIEKFNQSQGWDCQTIEDVYNRIKDKTAANAIINSLKICDPAVGSGHFLVSALNEIIAIKSELQILVDKEGKTLRDYRVEVVNDELIVTDDDGNLFEYNPRNRESQRVQETLFQEKQRLIEGCLFGVDINPNSVKICRLRLWIELLKNAYYKADNELETLPNIDINIKVGNSLISRFGLSNDLQVFSRKSRLSIESYKDAVRVYRNAEDKSQKREMERLISEIKSSFRQTLQGDNPLKKRLRGLETDLYSLENQILLFEESPKEKKARERKISQLRNEIDKLRPQLEEIESGKIYHNAFEWRFEFPEVLDDKGNFIGFDVIIGNPPYGVKFKEMEKRLYKEFYTTIDDIYTIFMEKATRISHKSGFFSFITPISWLTGDKYYSTRKIIYENSHLVLGITLPYDIFNDAYVDTGIYLLSKNKSLNMSLVYEFNPRDKIDFNIINSLDYHILSKKEWSNSQDLKLIFNPLSKLLNNKLSKIQTTIEDITDSARGILANKNDYSLNKIDDFHEPILTGKLDRYFLEDVNEYIKYGDNLREKPSSFDFFTGERILVRRIISRQFRIMATLTQKPLVVKKDIYIFKLNTDRFSIKYLLSIINSKFVSYLKTKNSTSAKKDDFTQLTMNDIRKLRIPIPTPNQVVNIENIVDQILTAKKSNPKADTSELEKEINQIVYELYGLSEEEIRIIEGEIK
jgi:hypothetical protein